VLNLIKSVLTTIAVSSGIALILLPLVNNFWAVFAVAAITQFVVFYIVGSVIDFLAEIKLKQIEAFKLAEYSKQGIEVECPCHRKIREFVPVTLNQKNSYKCNECGKNNSILIHAETAYLTEPISQLTAQLPDDKV